MQFSTLSILSLLATLAPLAVSQSKALPACMNDCGFVSSLCDGDETGDALDKCTCATLTSAKTLISCVKANCNTADQADYASRLPALCRTTLFPNITITSTTSGSSTQGLAATSTGSGSGSTTPTAGSNTPGEAAGTARPLALGAIIGAGAIALVL